MLNAAILKASWQAIVVGNRACMPAIFAKDQSSDGGMNCP